MESGLLISDAAKEVQVESHVLRYWEEELELPIRRNEQGHRYYTDEDVACFKQIKIMKERGLQLKAIKLILKDGKFDILPADQVTEQVLGQASEHMSHPSGQASEHVLQQMSGQTSEPPTQMRSPRMPLSISTTTAQVSIDSITSNASRRQTIPATKATYL